MVDSVAPAGGGFSGGDLGSVGLGPIGSGGLSSFDLGGIAPNGGGPEPTSTGNLGAAGLSPIGSSGLSAFDLGGIAPNGGMSEAAKLDRYDGLVQQNWDHLNAARQSNDELLRSSAQIGGQTGGLDPLSGLAPGPLDPPGFTPMSFTPMRFAPAAPDFLPPPGVGLAMGPMAPGLDVGPALPTFAALPPDPTAFAPPPSKAGFALPPEAGGPAAAPVFGDALAALPGIAPVIGPDALASPVIQPDIDAPVAIIDPFASVTEGGLGLTPVGAPTLTGFGLDGPVPRPGAEAGFPPAADAAAFQSWPVTAGIDEALPPDWSILSPTPVVDQAGFSGTAPEGNANLLFDPAPLAQWGLGGTPLAPAPALPAAPPPIGYGDRPLGVPVHEIGRLTSADAQAYVGSRMDAFRDAATPPEQDRALQDALNGAYAYRVQGGDTDPFDRIAERVEGNPRAEVELRVARDRAEAIVAAGVSGSIRALNRDGVNFGAQLYALQRTVTNDPDNAIGPIRQTLSGLRDGPGAASLVNAVQLGATQRTLTALGFGREIQDAAALDRMTSEAARTEQRRALAAMPPSERFSYLAGQAMDAGALLGTGLTLGMAAAPARFGQALSNDYKGTFFAANPALRGQVVVHHAVEQQALRRFPGVLTPTQIHSLENLRGIPNGVNAQLHLSQIRREWNQFYRQNPNPTPQQFLDKATDIDNKFGSQFNPPIR